MTDQISALQSFTYTGLSNNGLTYNFSYSLTNNSIADSRIRSFGFNVVNNVALDSLSATGVYYQPEQNQTFPEGLGVREICFGATSSGTCTGGPEGLTSNPDQTGTGTFQLTFAQAMSSLTLDDFATRFQSIAPTINGSNSGVGIGSLVTIEGPVSAAPEPATWAMMLVGFGLIGMMMRTRPTALAARRSRAY
jgi:hypothetical protein